MQLKLLQRHCFLILFLSGRIQSDEIARLENGRGNLCPLVFASICRDQVDGWIFGMLRFIDHPNQVEGECVMLQITTVDG